MAGSQKNDVTEIRQSRTLDPGRSRGGARSRRALGALTAIRRAMRRCSRLPGHAPSPARRSSAPARGSGGGRPRLRRVPGGPAGVERGVVREVGAPARRVSSRAMSSGVSTKSTPPATMALVVPAGADAGAWANAIPPAASREPQRPVRAHAGQDHPDPDRLAPLRLCQRLQERIDCHARGSGRLDRAQRAVREDQALRRRDDVDPVRLHPHVPLDLGDLHRRGATCSSARSTLVVRVEARTRTKAMPVSTGRAPSKRRNASSPPAGASDDREGARCEGR